MVKNFYKPTPVWAQNLGNSLLAASATITSYAVATNNHTIALVSLWVGVGGKFFSNLFSSGTTTQTPANLQAVPNSGGGDGDNDQDDGGSNPADKPGVP